MPPTRFACPECRSLLQDASGLPVETNVRCPRCGHVFRLADAVDPDAPAAPTSAGPISNDPAGFADEPLPAPPKAASREPSDLFARAGEATDNRWRDEDDYDDRPRRQRGLTGVERDTAIEMDQYFKLAGAHYSDVMGAMIGYLFLYFLIAGATAVIAIGPLLRTVFLDPPLLAGFVIVALKQLKGERWEFGDFFGGFKTYGSLIVNQLMILGITFVMMLPYVGIIIMLISMNPGAGGGAQAAQQKNLEAALPILIGVQVVFLIIGLYFLFRLSCFNVPLIIDRECSVTEAIQASWMLTGKHFWGLLGVGLLMGLINLGGVMLLCVGVLFTMPYTHLIWAACYLLLAGSRPPVSKG